MTRRAGILTTTRRCACCELDRAMLVDDSVCTACAQHGSGAEVERDHATLYRRSLIAAQDETDLARGERDFHRDRAAENDRNNATLVRVLVELEGLHGDRGAGCSCGEADCRVRALIGAPAVSRLIGTFDEHRHTLSELRRANPGLLPPEPDWVDVAVSHPRPRPRVAGPRQRAAG